MNLLTGKISWTPTMNAPIQENNRFNNGVLDLHITRNSNFTFDRSPYFYNQETGILCCMLGYISNIAEIESKYSQKNGSDVEIIEKLYSQKGLAFISELDGIFLIIVFDTHRQKVYVLQSGYFTSYLPVYYAQTKSGIVFSTSLRQLLKRVAIKRELNIAAVYDFLYCENIITNETTLIKNVNKLVPQRYIEIDIAAHSVMIKPFKLREKRISKTVAKDSLIRSIETGVGALLRQLNGNTAALTLTSGWDTNLILYSLRKLTSDPIIPITIKGTGEIDEVPQVKSILRNYQNVRHVVGLIEAGKDDVHSLPDIVWRYEGYVFDAGMFLRYKLSKILSAEKCGCVFLGSCSDQVMFPSIVLRIKNIVRPFYYRICAGKVSDEKKLRINGFGRSSGFTYHTYIDYNQKLHEIMLNSFGIHGLFPFLNMDTAKMSKALAAQNWRKKLYKEKAKQVMGAGITQHIAKSGNVIDTARMFDENKNMLMAIFQKEFFGKILTRQQIDKIRKEPEKYHVLILQLVYVYLVNELFISGKFDSKLDDSGIDVPLSDFAYN